MDAMDYFFMTKFTLPTVAVYLSVLYMAKMRLTTSELYRILPGIVVMVPLASAGVLAVGCIVAGIWGS